MIKDGVRKIVGKRVTGVMVKTSSNAPRAQVFLVFNDGTYYEFYSSVEISSGGSIDTGGREEIIEYMANTTSIVLEAWKDGGITQCGNNNVNNANSPNDFDELPLGQSSVEQGNASMNSHSDPGKAQWKPSGRLYEPMSPEDQDRILGEVKRVLDMEKNDSSPPKAKSHPQPTVDQLQLRATEFPRDTGRTGSNRGEAILPGGHMSVAPQGGHKTRTPEQEEIIRLQTHLDGAHLESKLAIAIIIITNLFWMVLR